MYNNGRPGYPVPPPPPPGGHHQPYNPKLHAQMAAAGQTADVPPVMRATYVPDGSTYGDMPGIPGFDPADSTSTLNSATSWLTTQTTDTGTTVPTDDSSSTLKSSGTNSSIAPEVAAQWPIDTVLVWLSKHQFSKDWQETFRALNLHGVQFLEIGTNHGGRGSVGMMHQHVYPRLKQECNESGIGWDERKEREEGKRLRRLIRCVVSGKPIDPSKMVSTAHARRESNSGNQGGTLPSAGTDPSESPNVSVPNVVGKTFANFSDTFEPSRLQRKTSFPDKGPEHNARRQQYKL